MASVQACVLTFTAITASSGVQTITGVVDTDGNEFIGRTFLFYNGAVGNNSLAYGSSFGHAYAFNTGIDMGDGRGGSSGTADTTQFGVTISSGGSGYGYSLLDVGANAFFGGDINRLARVTAVRLGEFDITYNINTFGGDSVVCVILGGDSLEITEGYDPTNLQTIPTTSAPVGVVFTRCQTPISTPPAYGSATGAGGGGGAGIGWSTRDDAINESMHILGQGYTTNVRYQRSTLTCVDVNPTTYVGQYGLTVASWGANSFTMSAGLNSGNSALAFSGSNVAARSGLLTQPLIGGTQTVDTGILPRLVILASYGAAPSTTALTDQAEIVVGFGSGNGQGSYWAGESGISPTLKGARYSSNSSVLRFGSVNGASTTFSAVASFAGITEHDGSFTLTWEAVDGVQRQVLWFVLGEATLPPPPNPPIVGCAPYLPN